jgi:hypothetical protein
VPLRQRCGDEKRDDMPIEASAFRYGNCQMSERSLFKLTAMLRVAEHEYNFRLLKLENGAA